MPERKKVILSEAQKKYILAESQESKSISAAKKLLVDRLGYNDQQADEFVRIKLRNDLPVLRTPQGGKFILGVTRMFLDGQLRSANDISNLNSTLKLIASDAHINEYDRNLNGLSCSELIERFSQARVANLEAEKEEVNAMKFNEGSQYDVVRIDSFGQAQKYGDYTSWCVTYSERMFNSYTANGINQFYFCLRRGFENVEKVAGKGCPLDEYGLSMIAVCVNEDGALNTCTCRWNHDNGGNDSIMSAVEISRVVGVNFFNTFKPNGKWQEVLNTALSRLQSHEAPEDVFDDIGDFEEGLVAVRLNDKWNFINSEGELISQQWFDDVDSFSEGLATVVFNNKYNFITREGKLISRQWFDWTDEFHEDFVWVSLNGKLNFINRNGELLSQQWFDNAGNFYEGFARVELNDKWNFISRNGELLSRQWFGWADNFQEGFAVIKLNDKWNFINRNGDLVSQQWFDNAREFQEGFAVVVLNGSWKYLDRNGKLWDEKPTIQEGMNMKKRKVILSEEQKKYILNEYGEKGSPLVGKKEGMPYYINPEKVKVVKKYLDTGFIKGSFEDIGDDGYPKTVSVVAMLDGNGDVIRNLTDVQLFYLLQDRFKNITANKQHRDSFLKQVIKDWFYDKIKPSGLLSVNMLREAREWNLILEAMSVADIYQKYYSDIPEDVYQTVVTQADPTYNPQKPNKMGIYTKWLLGMVRKGTFKPGDATEARDLLTVFGKFKNKLEVKDVTHLHSMRELYDVVKPFMGQQTTGEKNREAKSGAEKVYEDGKWMVIIPHTEEAAKLYGKGTKWCTAADNNNMFNYYNEDGPLYIIINKSNPSEKYQFHFETNQYMDAEDKEIDIDAFCEKNPGIKAFVNKQKEERERRFQEKVDDALSDLHCGESPVDVFDEVNYSEEGLATVMLNKKWNFLTREGRLLSEKWFDWADNFQGGFAIVCLNGEGWNLLTRKGKLLSPKWFDRINDFYDCEFREGFGMIRINRKYNFIDSGYNLLSQNWFDKAGNFSKGFARVMLNNKWNFLTRDGRYLSEKWFDWVGDFHEGFAMVELNDKVNFINRSGVLLSEQWFFGAYADGFNEGFAKVELLDGSRKFIDSNGKLWDERPTIQESMKK